MSGRETIELTELLRQSSSANPREEDSAIAYMGFDADSNSRLFLYYRDAEDYAERMMENTGEGTWEVFPLYAARPLIV